MTRHLVMSHGNRLHKLCCWFQSENPVQGVISFMSQFRDPLLAEARSVYQLQKTACFTIILTVQVKTEVTLGRHFHMMLQHPLWVERILQQQQKKNLKVLLLSLFLRWRKMLDADGFCWQFTNRQSQCTALKCYKRMLCGCWFQY